MLLHLAFVKHSFVGASRFVAAVSVIGRLSPREQLDWGCRQTSDEGCQLRLHPPYVEERGSCEGADSAHRRSKPTTIRRIRRSGRRFQPAAGGGMIVEGRREARECSWGGGGRVWAATDRHRHRSTASLVKWRFLSPQKMSQHSPTCGAGPQRDPRRSYICMG
jgi:hypothetical protein